MKLALRTSFLTLASAASATADVIYSDLQDLSIPKNNTGLYLNVLTGSTSTTNWHINPTFGGINVYNSADFQPLRESNSGLGTLSNIAPGGLIESTSPHFSTGYGASGDHLATTFTAGTEGYLGFSVVEGLDTRFGWMRVVFTGTGTPLIKDWAYDTSGGSVAAGNVIQSGSTYTLDSSTQSFALGSAISGANNLVKTGSNTVTMNAANGYSGNTNINAGTLALGASGSIGGSSIITVASGATLDVSAVSGGWTLGAAQTLTGPGGVTGNVTIAGTHSPSTGLGSQAFDGDITYASGSTFEWDLTQSSTSTGFDTVSATGTLSAASGSEFHIVLGSSVLSDMADPGNEFWNLAPFHQVNWNLSDIFGLGFSGSFSTVSPSTDISTYGSFSINGSNLTWTAIPEPTTALGGLLLTVGLLRRRRATA